MLSNSERIMREVCDAHGLTMRELRSDNRSRAFSWPRQVAYLRLYDETNLSLPQIARLLGKKDHTTVLYGIEAMRKKIKDGLIEGETHECCQLQESNATCT